jgi:hypothetical protein
MTINKIGRRNQNNSNFGKTGKRKGDITWRVINNRGAVSEYVYFKPNQQKLSQVAKLPLKERLRLLRILIKSKKPKLKRPGKTTLTLKPK